MLDQVDDEVDVAAAAAVARRQSPGYPCARTINIERKEARWRIIIFIQIRIIQHPISFNLSRMLWTDLSTLSPLTHAINAINF